uniref:Uncharacterized protein n=1 Tax=Coprothermobacter proteolyticus (strain ATCC 35245 / DSM 5265 / OCM 4 / BT) TaxID=309798 RepID=B5Y9H9_COPPD
MFCAPGFAKRKLTNVANQIAKVSAFTMKIRSCTFGLGLSFPPIEIEVI